MRKILQDLAPLLQFHNIMQIDLYFIILMEPITLLLMLLLNLLFFPGTPRVTLFS